MVVRNVHTLIIGSGAAGLNAALQLHRKGINDIVIVTEGLDNGTSINTGSDKQTYYKPSMAGPFGDSPLTMAESLFSGGAMHGDIALVESAVSARAFHNLVELGIPFPTDSYGQYVGYTTDHDNSNRATSIGPYTSREMCRALIAAVQEADIPVHENRTVIELITLKSEGAARAAGAIALTATGSLEVYKAENTIFAVGGPGGLYKNSVYPKCHAGAIGLALQEGAAAANLSESQFGLASTKFRWNVSGTYMQAIPRFVSTDLNGGDEYEFLEDFFSSSGTAQSMTFLKGYQWPFDVSKVKNGSSIIDILVYIETVEKGRKVFLDFTQNPKGYSTADLTEEAETYLRKSDALLSTPIARLEKMNPGAVQLYLDHGIDIRREMLEIALCAQHNNGGLAATIWWESINIMHLFPVGEVNGSHGVKRPGGSALNSGQVGGFRAAEYISNTYAKNTVDDDEFSWEVKKRVDNLNEIAIKPIKQDGNWKEERDKMQERMSRYGATIRETGALEKAVTAAKDQLIRITNSAVITPNIQNSIENFTNRHLCVSQIAYLEAILFSLKSGIGSRGSALVIDGSGDQIHPQLETLWKMIEEDITYRDKILLTRMNGHGNIENSWIDRRPVPNENLWFETAWEKYRKREIYL